RSQLIPPTVWHEPCAGTTLTSVTPWPAKVSLTSVCAAGVGPLLVTVTTNGTCVFASTEPGELTVTDKSGGSAPCDGVTEFDCADSVPSPMALVACTVKVYAVPLVRPVTNALCALPGTIAVMPVGTPPTSALTV